MQTYLIFTALIAETKDKPTTANIENRVGAFCYIYNIYFIISLLSTMFFI